LAHTVSNHIHFLKKNGVQLLYKAAQRSALATYIHISQSINSLSLSFLICKMRKYLMGLVLGLKAMIHVNTLEYPLAYRKESAANSIIVATTTVSIITMITITVITLDVFL